MKNIVIVFASLLIAACASAPKPVSSPVSQTNDKNITSAKNVTTATVSTAEIESRK